MDRNSVVGLVLIALVLVVFSIMNSPSEEEIKRQQFVRDSIAQVQAKDTAARTITVEEKDSTTIETAAPVLVSADSAEVVVPGDSTGVIADSVATARKLAQLNERYSIFAPSAEGEDKEYILENDKIRLTFLSKGGRLAEAELKEYLTYQDYAGEQPVPLKLFDRDSTSFGLNFYVNDLLMSSNDLFFASQDPEVQMTESKDSISLTFTAATNESGKNLQMIYSLKKGSYVMDVEVRQNGLEKYGVAPSLELTWNAKLLSTEKVLANERMVSSVFYKYKDEGRSYLSETGNDELNLETETEWIAFKQSYFSAVLMSKQGFNGDGSQIKITNINSQKYIKEYAATINLANDPGAKVSNNFQLYVGPNDYHTLSQYGNDMEDIVNLGWGIFGWVNKGLVIPIFNLLEGMGMNYGLIIILLTLVVKILILPLTYKNYMSSAKMRVLKPEVDEINKRMADDPVKKQQEVLALYRRSGVNPMAGCIPMLIQMPVLIAVFRFFPAAIALRQEKFLWAEDLSAYDSVLEFGFNIPLYGDHISLFTLLMAATTIMVTRMNSSQVDTSMPGMKFMMYFFPVMMIFFFNSYSSGLTFYYFISNLMSILIMWGIKKYWIDEEKILAKIHENRKNPKLQKKSAFMQRLEEAAKQQQQKKRK